jgi:hypothetical protein
MIKTLSPYYINVPFVSPLTGATALSYTLNLFIWNGNKNAPPVEPQYQITKSNPTGSLDFDKINIARLINDFLTFAPTKTNTTELINGDNQVWVRTEISYTTIDPLDDGVLQLPETVLGLKGYTYGLDGENGQPPTNKILLPLNDYKVDRNGTFNVPILIDETIDTSELVLISVVNTVDDDYEYTFSSNFAFDELYSQLRFNEDSIGWFFIAIFSGGTSPQTRTITLSSFQTQIFAYNEATGNLIFSNIITV